MRQPVKPIRLQDAHAGQEIKGAPHVPVGARKNGQLSGEGDAIHQKKKVSASRGARSWGPRKKREGGPSSPEKAAPPLILPPPQGAPPLNMTIKGGREIGGVNRLHRNFPVLKKEVSHNPPPPHHYLTKEKKKHPRREAGEPGFHGEVDGPTTARPEKRHCPSRTTGEKSKWGCERHQKKPPTKPQITKSP